MKCFILWLFVSLALCAASNIVKNSEYSETSLHPAIIELDKYLDSSDFRQLPWEVRSKVIASISKLIDISRTNGSTENIEEKSLNKNKYIISISSTKNDDGKPQHNIETNTPNKTFGVGVDGEEIFVKNEPTYPKNCYEILKSGVTQSGIYAIKPSLSAQPFKVLCDMTTQGGGWTHIQKRVDGRTDFNRGWADYKFGFGYLDEGHEFWMGLQNIHALTGKEATELLVEIVDREGMKAYALYKSFAVGDEQESYPLSVLSGYNGDAGESLSFQLGMKFSTFDFDQDTNAENCAEIFKSGWWYRNCFQVNLNGKFTNIELPQAYIHMGIHWKGFRSLEYCHSSARMLVRPTQY